MAYRKSKVLASAEPGVIYERFLSYIPIGKANAVSMRVVASRLEMTERDVREIVLTMRKSGYLVASCPNGYYIPQTKDELLNYYNRRKRAILSSLLSLKACRKALKEIDGQMSIDPRGATYGDKIANES